MDKIWITIEYNGKAVFSTIKEYDHIVYDFVESHRSEQDMDGQTQIDVGTFKVEGRTTKKSTDVPEEEHGN
jgi:hypothetical protein